MIRQRFVFAALLCSLLGGSQLWAANAWFSLNLEFNDPSDFGSGGTWTVVGKADESGLSAVILEFVSSSLNFNPATGFLTPAPWEVEESGTSGLRLETVQGEDVFTPVVYDIGVIGGTYPSSYVDDPNLIIFGANPDLGSFTGGVELVTGAFDPGDVPTWWTAGGDTTIAQVFTGNGVQVALADTFTTVRYVGIPEPSSMLIAMAGILAFAGFRRN